MNKKKKLLQAITSVVLVLVMTVMLPMEVLALPLEASQNESLLENNAENSLDEESQSEEETPHILTELEEERSADTKHFLLSNGNRMAVQYEYPVHFKEEDDKDRTEKTTTPPELDPDSLEDEPKDIWIEYDNTMQETTEKADTDVAEELTLPPTEPATEELTEEATEEVAQDTTQPDETVPSAAEYTSGAEQTEPPATEPVTDAAAGETEPATQMITEAPSQEEPAAEELFGNKRSDVDIKLAKKAKSNNMVKIKTQDYHISWGYEKIDKSSLEFVEHKEKLEGDAAFLTPTNVTQEALYKDVFKDVDLQYFITPVGVKENIILKSITAQTAFTLTYKFKSLTAVQKDDWTIELKNKDGETVYEIAAPFMTDAKGEISTQLKLTIESQKNNKLTVVLSADEQWVQDSAREFPIVIDPAFNTSQKWQAVQCTYVDSSNPNTCYGYDSPTGYTGTVYAGSFGLGNYKSYIKMNSLPTLNKGDMIVDAYLNLHLYQNDFYKDMYVNAYHVTGKWEQSSLTWNSAKNVTYESNAIDYEKFVENDSTVWHDWNVTSSAKRWYEGEANNGIMLNVPNESAADQCASFYSSNYPSSSIPRTVFTIVYRNNKGLEDYWTYTDFAVGTAGTACINDYTGNLVFMHNDAATPGSRMPASISHVFNNYTANVRSTDIEPIIGRGWRMNIQQTLYPSSKFGLTGDAASQYPYVWTDGDGTDHYFYKKTENGKTTYVDEDGMKLELTINSTSQGARYVIKDEKDNKTEFDANGYMRKIIDANGNAMTVNYITSNSKKILTVTDGAGKKLTLGEVAESGYLRSITDPAGRVKQFFYSGGNLVRILNPDGTNINLTYDIDGSLKSVTDIDGYKVEFSYSSLASGKQVTGIQEYGTDGTAGQKITFDRKKYNTTIMRSAGVDGVYGNTDDLISTMQFDNFGRLTSTKSKTGNKDMGAAGCQYTSGAPNSTGSNLNTINRVTNQYSLGSNAVNFLLNHNMEESSNWTKAAWGGTNTFTGVYSTVQKYSGKRSYKLTCTEYSAGSNARAYQNLGSDVLLAGRTYTLSGYIKTTGTTPAAENAGAYLGVTLFTTDGNSTTVASQYVTGNTDGAVNNGWRRVSATFTVPTNINFTRINMALRNSTGTAYFDALQVEQYNQPNTYNMLENSSMESGTTIPTSWIGNFMDTSTDKIVTTQKQHSTRSFMVKGDPTKNKELVQTIEVSGDARDTYMVSGWAKANAVKETSERPSKFKLSIRVLYTSGDAVWKQAAEFNDSITDWQFASSAFNLEDPKDPKKIPTKVEVYVRFFQQMNTAYFDNIQLIKDVAQSYTYDDDGKLISTQKNAEQKASMEYSNADLTKSIDAKGYAYTYDYDSKHNMTKATSQRNITSNYTYDSTGVPTQLEVKNPAGDASYLTSLTYTSNKAFISKATDADGRQVTYNYNQNTGTLTSASDDSGTVNYSYNAKNNLLTGVSKYLPEEGRTISNTYGYTAGTNRNLTTISHNGGTYNIAYDAFNNMTQTKVGSQTLASYEYGANNNRLQKLTYGNGKYIDYTYDDFGNLSLQKNNGVNAYQWFSDRSGAATKHKDLINKIEYDYDYDVTGRLVRQSAIDTSKTGANDRNIHALEYGYDANNNVTKLSNITAFRSARNQYEYGKDNLPTKYTIDGSRVTDYTHDSLNRLTKVSIGTTTPLTMEYSYYLSKRNTGTNRKYKTSRLSEEKIAGKHYLYYYDELGNITEIKENVNGSIVSRHYYEYDELNQLVYDLDRTEQVLKQYRYDSGGNLTYVSRSKLGANGVPISTTSTSYAYGDSNWKDKLTGYNGKTITYDAIGNPLSYRDGMTMTWQNGRQLKSLQASGKSIQYTYDSAGIRSTKIVNGEKYTYQYAGGKLIHETRGEKSFDYYYDTYGNLTSIKYQLTPGGTVYAYYATHNSRGDIVGLYTGSGVLVAAYTYDSWGNVLSIKDASGASITNASHIGNLNPFRYRGYYMDTETGLYYLMSRYYDPVTCRFVNADGYFQTGQGFLDKNMSAYCENNPIMRSDPSGMCYKYVKLPYGGVMGNQWFMGYQVPGVPDLCGYCNKYRPGSAGFVQQMTPTTASPSSSKYFNTIDDAAIDFVVRYNTISVKNCQEYGAPINQVEVNGKIMYTYPDEPFIGPVRYDETGECSIDWDAAIAVAIVHTHGQYVVDENNDFSRADKNFNVTFSAPYLQSIYVGTPSGLVRRYNFGNRSDVVIFSNAPR